MGGIQQLRMPQSAKGTLFFVRRQHALSKRALMHPLAHGRCHIRPSDIPCLLFHTGMLVNVFERLREEMEPARPSPGGASHGEGETSGGGGLLYVAAVISSLMMRLFSALLSRQREFMADAAAVELCRDPMGLAKGIYKANTRFSQVLGSTDVYSPIFIVDPRSHGLEDEGGFFGKLFGSHPPAMKRIQGLCAMMGNAPPDVLREIRTTEKERLKNRTIFHPFVRTEIARAPISHSDQREWMICGAKGQWQGPFLVEELIFLPFFTPSVRVKKAGDETAGKAFDFDPVREVFHRVGSDSDHAAKNKCPRCEVPLASTFYEGVPVQSCATCGGKFALNSAVERILIRDEMGFDEALVQKALDFKETVLVNPLKHPQSAEAKTLLCPKCGAKMMPHPFSYQYFVPTFKCFLCKAIWFDPDNLEILQILVEENKEKTF